MLEALPTIPDSELLAHANERTALISSTNDDEDSSPSYGSISSAKNLSGRSTPLPIGQLAILYYLQLAEPMSSQVILPFINELVGQLPITGGDESKTGYYVGVIQSCFFLVEALTILQWSRASDTVGRKPILLIGLSGLALSMFAFGLSKTFVTLIISRCLNGLLNGNIGIIKCMIGDLTDSTNVARAFAVVPLIWSLGMTIAPAIGGTLSRPADNFPRVFKGAFWAEYPYFLPCMISACVAVLGFVITLLFLKETVEQRPTSLGAHELATEYPPSDGPLPLRRLMTNRVLIAVSNYCLFALLEIGLFTLLPVFYNTPVSLGGLGLAPFTIGYVLSTFGIVNGCIQVFAFPYLISKIGARNLFLTGISSFVPIFTLFPAMNTVAKTQGISRAVWALTALQLLLMVAMDMCYGTIFLYVTAAPPSKRALGSVNGIAQTTASIARAIGPAACTSLFAFSSDTNALGGHLVYLVMIVLSASSLLVAVRLPVQPWSREDDG